MKPTRLASLACALALFFAVAATAEAGGAGKRSKGAASPASVVVRDVERSAREVRAYWTPRRMRRAQPAPLRPPPSAGGAGIEAPLEPGAKPRLIPPAYPLSGSTAGRTASRTAMNPRSGAEPRTHHPVSREEVTDTTSFPNRTHGKVFFTLPSEPPPNDFACSATVVTANNRSLVITAGHCVHAGSGGSFATNWMFAPGYRNGNAPFGSWAASELASLAGWVNGEDVSYDVGAAVMHRDGSGRAIQDVVGARGIAFNEPRDQFYRAFGYPALPPPLEFNGERLFVCNSPYGGDDATTSPPQTMRIACDMTQGSSGGGWVVSDAFVESVNSYTIILPIPELDHLYGPYFGTEVANLYNGAQGPPETTIESGPPEGALIDDPTPTFGFSASVAGSTFECRVDGGAFGACSPPHTIAPLGDGPHTFEVRATDPAGKTDPTPAQRSFTVDTDPPETKIANGPPKQTEDHTAKLKFASDEPGSSFECKLDRKPFGPCASPTRYRGLDPGEHRFKARATDQVGNTDPTPAKRKWTVKR